MIRLKLGIKKNSNGVWEVSKFGEINIFFLNDRVYEKFENCGFKVVSMSSSVIGSGRDGEESVN